MIWNQFVIMIRVHEFDLGMNLPAEKLYSLGRHKMFKCWKCSSSDPMLVGFNIFITLFSSLMIG